MSRPNNSFRTLSSVPIHYDRIRPQDYGTRGTQHVFYATPAFEAKLDGCFEQLWAMCPWGRAEVITSAGAYVAKPGFHGEGRALDLDGIFWSNKTFITLYDGYQARNRPLYLAIEAVIRMNFGQVLNYDFNAPHRDHFHIDDVAPGFRQGARSAVYFVQNALTYVLGINVARDGVYGDETEVAVRRALQRFGISGSIGNADVWRQFLNQVARAGFNGDGADRDLVLVERSLAMKSFDAKDENELSLENEENISEIESGEEKYEPSFAGTRSLSRGERANGSSPLGLLNNLYEVVGEKLEDSSLKPTLEGAITAFASHPEIQSLLKRYDRELSDAEKLENTFENIDRELLYNLYTYREQEARERMMLLSSARAVTPNMMFFHFDYEGDPRDGKFVNPLDVKPNLSADKKYQLDYEMVTLHVDDLIDELKINKNKPLEHRLFTQVPFEKNGQRDWLEWMVTSAIDVFLEKDREGRDKKLQAFAAASTPTATLREVEKIMVEKGQITIGQGLWGHKEKNWFSKFWGLFAQVLSSPLIAAAGLPALVPTAVKFVDKILKDYEEESKIRRLWESKRLNFKIAADAEGDFGLKAGMWILIDKDYVQQHPNLEKHKVDFQFQTFEILDASNKPIDAPYLVNKLRLKQVP